MAGNRLTSKGAFAVIDNINNSLMELDLSDNILLDNMEILKENRRKALRALRRE